MVAMLAQVYHDLFHHLDHDLTDQFSIPPLPRMSCIRTRVDDTGGLMDGPCEVDAS